jgi:hypothetical protein
MTGQASGKRGMARCSDRIRAVLRGLAASIRREELPATIGRPPSTLRVPVDAAEHASDSAGRYAEQMDYLVSQRMMDLGIPVDQIGASPHNFPHAALWPHERTKADFGQ